MGKGRGRACASAIEPAAEEMATTSLRRAAVSPSLKRVLGLSSSLLGAIVILSLVAPGLLDWQQNAIAPRPPYVPSAHAVDLGRRLPVVDLHADSLLWGRDLLKRNRRGHVDVPRLIEGNVALEAFTIVTKTPYFVNLDHNEDGSDMLSLLTLLQRWPLATWGSLKERVLYQARRLEQFAARSNGTLVVIRSAQDLERYLTRRAHDKSITAGFLGVEGAHALEGDLDNIDVFYDAGVRMMAPTHFFDTDVGGSAHGVRKGGLTDLGREMIRRMEAKRMLVDLAHASANTIDDALAIATRPLVVSHTGVRGTCDNNRNLHDDHVRAIVSRGGLIGIGYWPAAICGQDGRAVARAIRHVVSLGGIDRVALGSDFDGATTTPFDTTGLAEVIDALLAEGFEDAEIAKIMGGNALRLLRENLPQV
jgi:microsomal dipeptidase-like Zn-dependent dipeptidase